MTFLGNIDRFLQWWVSGLLTLLPAQVRELIQPTPNYLLLEIDNSTLEIHHHDDNGELLKTRQFRIEEKLELGSLQNWLFELRDTHYETIFMLPSSKLLVKKVTLPYAAKDNIREALSFELNRTTPFTADDVYYDFLIVESDSDKDKIEIELIVCQKAIVDSLLSQFTKWPIRIMRMSTMNDRGLYYNINLLPIKPDNPQDKAKIKLPLVLVSSCCLLLITALYLPLSKHEQTIAALEASMAERQQMALELEHMFAKKSNLLSRIHFLDKKKIEHVQAIKLIDELTKVLPDDTWLNRLVIRNSVIQMEGESSTATALIQIIENSTYFQNTHFQSPLTHNDSTNKDKFSVKAELAKKTTS
ncbi:MAG: hypothetical protein GKR93_17945 [Gammaproteobacteria bacterium]|nr:hypothetical protein [Gammaproteobacteria bacterium]